VPAPTSQPTSNRKVHLGYSLSTEEHAAPDLVRFARRAEAVGFEYASISDHFHPWVDAQGNSPFAWSVLGAIANATDKLKVGTGVTCPTMRYHPAIVAQAAATVASLMPGRFFLGLGTGEQLNEHVIAPRWPSYETRAGMLEEAVEIIRALWTGETVDHQGQHFTVDNARLYSLPDEPPPIIIAAAGPKAARLASRIGDGLINPSGDADVVKAFEENGQRDRPRYLQVSVCWHEDEAEARRLAHRLVPSVALPGELGNLLPTPTHYQQAVQLVKEEDIAEVITCGPDPQRHIERIQAGIDAGYDHIHVYQVGPDQEGFFRFYEREILPAFC
jgi:coenzyme F420-dependent glucose-6-phosphate dehydrogenase